MTAKKVILITGASSGLGEELATYLSTKGYIVYGASRNLQEDEKRFYPLTMDVIDEESINKSVEKILKDQGRIDVLINNAGMVMVGPIEFSSTQDIEKVFRTNVFGALNITKAVLPTMRKQQSGLIISIGSVMAIDGIPLPNSGTYNSSKAALARYVEALRSEVSKFGIKCCLLQLGSISNTNIYPNGIITNNDAADIYGMEQQRKDALSYIKKGVDKTEISKLIHKIINSRKVKSRYRLCKLPDTLLIAFRRILPEKITRAIIEMYLKLP